MKYKIVPIDEVAMIIEEADNAADAMGTFAWNMEQDMNCYFRAVPLDPNRRCSNCKNRAWNSWSGVDYCMSHEMSTTDEEDIDFASECQKYEKGTPECLEEEHYCPSATAGDYSPSSPWNAPGMSMRDFI